MPQTKLTESQRVAVRMQMGRVSRKILAARYGVSERTIRRAFNLATPEAKKRKREQARGLNIPSVGYRARGCGPGLDARCTRCDRVLKPEDFTTDLIMGTLIETTVCAGCVG